MHSLKTICSGSLKSPTGTDSMQLPLLVLFIVETRKNHWKSFSHISKELLFQINRTLHTQQLAPILHTVSSIKTSTLRSSLTTSSEDTGIVVRMNPSNTESVLVSASFLWPPRTSTSTMNSSKFFTTMLIQLSLEKLLDTEWAW